MEENPAIKRAKIDPLAVHGEEAISFQIVTPDLASIKLEDTFAPEMTHQLLGEEELVKGYENPHAVVSLNLWTYQNTLSFKYSSKQVNATELLKLLCESFAAGQLRDVSKLLSSNTPSLSDAAFGKLASKIATGDQENIKIYHSDLSKADAGLKELHGNAQQLLPYFIDGATGIDQDEPEWTLFTAVSSIEGKNAMVGFCTVYRLYAYPDSGRLRVSQIFVLPPFQRQGIGKALLEAVYGLADANNLQDVIYEDPTPELQMLRERIELERASKHTHWLTELAEDRNQTYSTMNGSLESQPPSTLALNPDHLNRAQAELRIPKQQVRLLWETLLAQQPTFQSGPGSFILRGLIARRLYGKFADTEEQAVGKRIFPMENAHGECFCMRHMLKSEIMKGLPVALEDKKEKGQSKEEREEALEKAIEARWETLVRACSIEE